MSNSICVLDLLFKLVDNFIMPNSHKNGGQRPANNSANYVPPLKSGNPVKGGKVDWWQEVCERYGEENHWPDKNAKKKKEEEKDSDSKNN